MIGGSMWIIKGVSILLTGDQPPVVFEAAMPLLAVGVVGLGARLGGPLGVAGAVVACVAAASAVAALSTELAPFIAVAGFGPFLGLILVGSAALQARLFPSPWNALPLALGLGGPLLLLAGGGLALLNERLLEVPIVIIGLAWVILGYSVLSERNVTSQEARPR
jgi:hypothetical protein